MFLKNKNIIFKIRRSKVTDYAALSCSLKCQPSQPSQSFSTDPRNTCFTNHGALWLHESQQSCLFLTYSWQYGYVPVIRWVRFTANLMNLGDLACLRWSGNLPVRVLLFIRAAIYV